MLATPHSLHEAQIAAAVAAGKQVFCEKPLALTMAGAEKAVALCRDAGLVLGMGHERRWEPPIADMLAKADAGTLGRIHQIEANFSHDKFLALDRDNWRLKADQAPAGGMTATGIHLLYVTGSYQALERLRPMSLYRTAEALGAAGFAAIGVAGLVGSGSFLGNFLPWGSFGQILSTGTVQVLSAVVGVEVLGSAVVLLAAFFEQEISVRKEHDG